jgi:redox-sensitive bicupin YhaK (pirin superfamily)
MGCHPHASQSGACIDNAPSGFEGEVDDAPGEPKGTPWHPHRGFETVTYMLDGVFQHQDSNGGGGLITDGDTQWMTAGAELSFWLTMRLADL